MDSLQSLPITFLEQTVLYEAVSFTHDSYDIIYLLSGRLTTPGRTSPRSIRPVISA